MLIIAELAGDQVALGRFQRAARVVTGGEVVRRAAGGRAIRVGQGTVGVVLAVPAGVSLLGGVPVAKVINRYVRGLLRGLGLLGAAEGAHYFGRDFVSASRRQLAVVSQNGSADGAVSFHAWVAVTRSLALPDTVAITRAHSDPRAGGPEPVTLADLWERPQGFAEIADKLALGFGAALGLPRVALDGAALGEGAIAFTDPGDGAVREVPIGFVEGHAAVAGGVIASAQLTGDLIAPDFVIDALALALTGAPATEAAIRDRVVATLSLPHATLLGVPDPAALVDALFSATSGASTGR